MPLTVRPLEPEDWPEVEAIYREGIEAGNATFESQPPTWDEFDAGKIDVLRLVAVGRDGEILGWAAASAVSSRDVYRGVVEHSVYVASSAQGRGVGRELLTALIETAVAAGYWMLQSSIFPENRASIVLHQRAGFRVVGRREAIALMTYGPHAGTWRDTVLVEWRSRRIGQPSPDAT